MRRSGYCLERQRKLTFVSARRFFGRAGSGCRCVGWQFGSRFGFWCCRSYFLFRNLVFTRDYVVAMGEDLVSQVKLFGFFFNRLAFFGVFRIKLGIRFSLEILVPIVLFGSGRFAFSDALALADSKVAGPGSGAAWRYFASDSPGRTTTSRVCPEVLSGSGRLTGGGSLAVRCWAGDPVSPGWAYLVSGNPRPRCFLRRDRRLRRSPRNPSPSPVRS